VSVYVQIIEDTAAESDEFFIVEIKSTEGVPVSKSMGKVTILDNDRPKSSPGGGSYGGWA
jgi:hypothetical protein